MQCKLGGLVDSLSNSDLFDNFFEVVVFHVCTAHTSSQSESDMYNGILVPVRTSFGLHRCSGRMYQC